MPKIKAATLAEHREAQRNAILEAAREIVVTQGPDAVKFGEVAKRAGLARSSIYEYFGAKADLLAALMASQVPGWKMDLQKALAHAVSPREAIRLFVETQLEMIAEGRHELPFALAGAQVEASSKEHIAAIHAEIFGLLEPALSALGIPSQEICLELVAGAIHTAASGLRRNGKSRELIASTVAFVEGGIIALAKQRPRKKS